MRVRAVSDICLDLIVARESLRSYARQLGLLGKGRLRFGARIMPVCGVCLNRAAEKC